MVTFIGKVDSEGPMPRSVLGDRIRRSNPRQVGAWLAIAWGAVTAGVLAGRALQAAAGEREWEALPLDTLHFALASGAAAIAAWLASALSARGGRRAGSKAGR